MSYAPTQEQRWDHARDLAKHEWRPGDAPTFDQRVVVAEMIGACEGLINSGVLGDELETKLRGTVARALVTFDMPSQSERTPA